MIITRAPLRISFVGGGTDLPDFYRHHGGKVISSTINQFVHIVLNRTPLVPKISARYSISETVNHPSELQHTRIKAMLLDLGITSNLEIASFGHLPARTGLGSSSSFSVALAKALHTYVGKKIDKKAAADAACRLEIDLLKEPVGKQDQYAAAFGGFNVFTFHPDETVTVEPVHLDFSARLALEDGILLFYTGITRDASSVLHEQRANIHKKIEVLKQMVTQVDQFHAALIAGDLNKMGKILHEGWQLKRSLASTLTNSTIDSLYAAGRSGGAYGGKLLGAGGGGCILFIAPPVSHAGIRHQVKQAAAKANLSDFREIPIEFTQSGAELIFNADHH